MSSTGTEHDEVNCAHAGGRLPSDITDALREAQQMHGAVKAGLLSSQHAAIQAAPHHHSSAVSHEASQTQPDSNAAGTPALSRADADERAEEDATAVVSRQRSPHEDATAVVSGDSSPDEAREDATAAVSHVSSFGEAREDATAGASHVSSPDEVCEDATAVVSHDSSPDEGDADATAVASHDSRPDGACEDATAVVSHDSSPDKVHEGNSLAQDAAGQLPDRGNTAAAPLLQQLSSPSTTLQPDVVKDQEEQQQQAGEGEEEQQQAGEGAEEQQQAGEGAEEQQQAGEGEQTANGAAKVLQQQEVGASQKGVCQDRVVRMDALYEQQVQHIQQSAAVMPEEAEVLVSDLIDYRQVMQELGLLLYSTVRVLCCAVLCCKSCKSQHHVSCVCCVPKCASRTIMLSH